MSSTVSLLDYSDLRCPDCNSELLPVVNAPIFICKVDGHDWCVTCTEFLRNAHGTQEARRNRIRSREVGRPIAEALALMDTLEQEPS